MKNFEEIKVIGDGAFGTVTKARDKTNREYVAIKKMKQRFENWDDCLQLKEVKSLRKIKHENVVRLNQIFRENDHLYLVFELLGDSLLKNIDERVNKPFKEEEIRFIISEILNGIGYVHKQGFFHRDLKPDNLLWDKNYQKLKIADFGLAREIRSRPPYTEYISTRWYRAPEIILRHQFYNSPVDIWAVGCIMAELYMMKPIFQGSSDTDQFFKICSILGSPNQHSWPDVNKLAQRIGFRIPTASPVPLAKLMPEASTEAIDLMYKLLSYDPLKRPSAAQALNHPFFKGPMKPLYSEPSNTHKSTSSYRKNCFNIDDDIDTLETSDVFTPTPKAVSVNRNGFKLYSNPVGYKNTVPESARKCVLDDRSVMEKPSLLDARFLRNRTKKNAPSRIINGLQARPLQIGVKSGLRNLPTHEGALSAKPELSFNDEDEFLVDPFD